MALPKVKMGDVFIIKLNDGFGVIQCAREASDVDCEIVRVMPGVYDSISDVNLKELLREKELYFVQFPLKYAVKKGCITFVGNNDIPEKVKLPRYYRTKHILKDKFICWHIVDSETLKRETREKLSEEEMSLSPWGVWNDTLLAERMAEDWNLEKWS